ncbi:hypothetical protein E2C01_043511 [Portunus trituberculatus]|uniref:Uncharacterized protein n=1 Tax=Portunus trituberculatus TaxID=210409 RepID=A0A5B7FPN6_PORTR|nr:hypothetical protein [Portunus trituberculatus]
MPTLAEQRATQIKWLKGTLNLCSIGLERGLTSPGELHGSPCSRQGTAKFEFKLPSVHSVVRGHPTARNNVYEAWRMLCKVSMSAPKARIPSSYHMPDASSSSSFHSMNCK